MCPICDPDCRSAGPIALWILPSFSWATAKFHLLYPALSTRRTQSFLSIIIRGSFSQPLLTVVEQYYNITLPLWHFYTSPLRLFSTSELYHFKTSAPHSALYFPIFSCPLMSRSFSSSVRALLKFIGFDKGKLPTFKQSLENAIKSGGKAEQVSWLLSNATRSSFQGFATENQLDTLAFEDQLANRQPNR